MKNKLIIMVILLLSGLSLAANENVISEFQTPSYEVNTSINFTSICFLDSNPCNENVTCNMTIYYPTMTQMAVTMNNNNNGIFSHLFDNTTLNIVGDYIVYIRCEDLTDDNVVPNAVDGSFRIVDKLLYHGGGIVTWDIAISLGIMGIMFVFSFLSVFNKSIWMKTLFMFGSLISMLIGSDMLMKIANASSQAGASVTLTGFYQMILWFSYFALAIFLILFFMDVLDYFGRLPTFAKKWKNRKNQISQLEE